MTKIEKIEIFGILNSFGYEIPEWLYYDMQPELIVKSDENNRVLSISYRENS